MNQDTSWLKERGPGGYALVGDPNQYLRHGFSNIPSLVHEGVLAEVFLFLSFNNEIP